MTWSISTKRSSSRPYSAEPPETPGGVLFVVRLVFLPVKVGTKATKVAAKTGYRTGRLLGYRRLFVLGVGIAIGLLLAPGPGRELREKIKGLLAGAMPPADPDLGERVRFELSHSPRTWHLPQP